jgi:hypothetical protein
VQANLSIAEQILMADNQLLNDNNDGVLGGGDDVFVYTGGDQQVPFDVRRLRIAENIDIILAETFQHCAQLIEVEGHNKLKKIKRLAFLNCPSLRRVRNMQGVIEVEKWAFSGCSALSDIDFDKLEIIGNVAFLSCYSLKPINMSSIRILEPGAFNGCKKLTGAAFGGKLERIEQNVFFGCTALRRIVIPLKDNLIIHNDAFDGCHNLSRVDTLAGGIHETIFSLHMESWRNEMMDEIDRINQTLPNTHSFGKTAAIQQWLERVLQRMEHYRTEHRMLLKEAMTLLELALWKGKLLNEADEKMCHVDFEAKKARIGADAAKEEHRVTCGASIVIKNVLPFLALE